MSLLLNFECLSFVRKLYIGVGSGLRSKPDKPSKAAKRSQTRI